MPQPEISNRNYPKKSPARSRTRPVPPVPPVPPQEEWLEEPTPELRKIIDEGLESIRRGEGHRYTTMEDLIKRLGLDNV